MRTLQDALCAVAAIRRLVELGAVKKLDADMQDQLLLADEIERLRNALRLVMACAGDIDKASDADLEAALECGDAETERQANAWLVAREALRPNAELTALPEAVAGSTTG